MMLKKMLGSFFYHPPHPTHHLLFIPQDILYFIFTYLHLKDLSALNKTCKKMQHYTNSDFCWMQVFHPRVKIPFINVSYKNMYKNIYDRMEFLFKQKGNYQFLLSNNFLNFEHINEQLNTYILPKQNQQLCFVLDESLTRKQKSTAAKASSYIYADQNNPWRKEFIFDKWFIDNIQVLNRGIKYIKQCAVMIIYTNDIKVLNNLLTAIKKQYKKKVLPFIFVITFNSKILAKDIVCPVLQLIHLCSKGDKSFLNESYVNHNSIRFQKIWYEISVCIAALKHTKKELENLAMPPTRFKALPREIFLELRPISDCTIS